MQHDKSPPTNRLPLDAGDDRIAQSHERRRGSRASPVGSAIVMTRTSYVGTYELENLSEGGALLVGEAGLAVGEQVTILLQLRLQSRRFAIEAFVVRHARQGDRRVFAIHFMNPSDEVTGQIRHAVHQARHQPPIPPIVLLIDASIEEAASLCQCVHALGLYAVAVQTPLDAIAWLEAKDVAIKAVLVRPRTQWPDRTNMLRCLAAEYPNVRRILISASDDPAGGGRAEESGLVDAHLIERCERDALVQAIGVTGVSGGYGGHCAHIALGPHLEC
jgi:PilZ domain